MKNNVSQEPRTPDSELAAKRAVELADDPKNRKLEVEFKRLIKEALGPLNLDPGEPTFCGDVVEYLKALDAIRKSLLDYAKSKLPPSIFGEVEEAAAIPKSPDRPENAVGMLDWRACPACKHYAREHSNPPCTIHYGDIDIMHSDTHTVCRDWQSGVETH